MAVESNFLLHIARANKRFAQLRFRLCDFLRILPKIMHIKHVLFLYALCVGSDSTGFLLLERYSRRNSSYRQRVRRCCRSANSYSDFKNADHSSFVLFSFINDSFRVVFSGNTVLVTSIFMSKRKTQKHMSRHIAHSSRYTLVISHGVYGHIPEGMGDYLVSGYFNVSRKVMHTVQSFVKC